MHKRVVLMLSVVLLAVQPVKAPVQPPSTAEALTTPQVPDITTVSVDGNEYAIEEIEERFSGQPLHFVADTDARAQGMLIAFTSEERRDAVYGIQPLAADEAAQSPEDIFPYIYDGVGFRGRAWIVRQSIANLGSFNDLTSSVFAGGRRGLILHESFNFRYCSFAVPGQSGVVDLRRYPLFCSVGGTWDNQTSSVRLW